MRVPVLVLLIACNATDKAAGENSSNTTTVSTTPSTTGDFTCPPEVAPGLGLGAAVLDLTLDNCDAQAVSFHESCGSGPTLVLNMAGWCAPCFEQLDLATTLMAENPTLNTLVVMTADAFDDPVEGMYCVQMRDVYDIGATWVMDTERAFDAYGPPGAVLVLDPGAVIVYSGQQPPLSEITDAVEAAL